MCTHKFYVKMPQECGQLVKDDAATDAVAATVAATVAVVVMLLPENLSQI